MEDKTPGELRQIIFIADRMIDMDVCRERFMDQQNKATYELLRRSS